MLSRLLSQTAGGGSRRQAVTAGWRPCSEGTRSSGGFAGVIFFGLPFLDKQER